MTPAEASSNERPWISNPEHDFDRMSLIDIYLNPFGKTPITHFRRAWLFLVLFALFTILLVTTLPGAARSGSITGPGALIVVLLVFSTIATASLHMRRAADAGKTRLWALIVLLPALTAGPLAVLGGIGGISKHASSVAVFEYNKDADGLKERDPEMAALAERVIKQRKEQAEKLKAKAEAREAKRKAKAEAQGKEYKPPQPRQRRGRRGPPGAQRPQGVPAQAFFVVTGATGAASAVWALTSFIAMLFSLIGFARWPSEDEDWQTPPPLPPQMRSPL